MGAPRRLEATHAVAAALACVVVPLASWIEGSRTFAWTMFSASAEYRIDVVTVDGEGRREPMNPTALAEHASPNAAAVLAGSDHWRGGASVATLASHLDDLARYACRETRATRVAVTLHERTSRGERAETQEAQCAP